MGDETLPLESTPPPTDGQVTTAIVDKEPKVPNPHQPRIDELTRKTNENAREAEYWRQRAQAAESQKTKTVDEPAKKPVPEDFGEYGEYVEALTDWKAGEKIGAELKKRDEQQAQTRQKETRNETFAKSVEAAKGRFTDYAEVMSVSEVRIVDHVADLLMESEHGASLMYYLDRHPEVAASLNNMPQKQAALRLGRIEASFETQQAPAEDKLLEGDDSAPVAPPAPKAKITNAPAPAKPTGGGNSSSKPLEKQSMDEYVESRKKQGAAWARRR